MAANESQADAVKGKEEPEKVAAEVEEDIPDPDEDDLDDLDGEPETQPYGLCEKQRDNKA